MECLGPEWGVFFVAIMMNVCGIRIVFYTTNSVAGGISGRSHRVDLGDAHTGGRGSASILLRF